MKNILANHGLFLFIILPFGILFVLYPETSAAILGKTGIVEGSLENVGITFLFFSIILLSIEKKLKNKRNFQKELK